MSWRERLRPASFRGVPFQVDGHDADYGRRQVTHEYPQRDEPYTEDLGRKARTFSIDGYLIGADYDLDRDKLRAACELAGPGELVHPYLGSMDVVCTGLKLRESTKEGRFCAVTITFTEAGKAQYPSSGNDAVSAVTKAASGVKSASGGSFLGKFLTKGYPSFVIDAAAGRITSLTGLLGKLPVNPLAEAQAVADFFQRVRTLESNATALVGSPEDMLAQITVLLGGIGDVFGTRSESVLRLVRSDAATPYTGTTKTPSRVQERVNHAAIGGLVRQVAVAEQARVAVLKVEDVSSLAGGTGTSGYATREEAISARDELADALDVEMEDPATSTEVYQALSALRAEVVRGIPGPDLRLPSVATVTPRATQPSLVMAYQLYADASRGDEIAARNRSRHPGFITGGQPIEVLSNG